jgi:hypothetical protein
MIAVQNLYPIVALAPTSATAGATITSALIDTKGAHYANLVVVASSTPAATYTPTTFAISEADNTNATAFNNIAAFTGGVAAGNFAIPAAQTATTTAPYALFNLDLRKRKRYLRLQFAPQTTQTVTVLAQLSRTDASLVGSITPANLNSAIVVTG